MDTGNVVAIIITVALVAAFIYGLRRSRNKTTRSGSGSGSGGSTGRKAQKK